MITSELVLEMNPNGLTIQEPLTTLGGGIVMTTPALDEDYWLMRVKVSENQAIVGFPKFFQCGIGFQVENDDWNTNLPSRMEAEEIFNHIKKNKGDDSISDEVCIEAIRMIKAAADAIYAQNPKAFGSFD